MKRCGGWRSGAAALKLPTRPEALTCIEVMPAPYQLFPVGKKR